MISVLLKRAGIRLASVVENLEESVSGQLVEHMMAAVAEFHSANLSEQTKKGTRQMVMQGGWPHLPPRGYAVDWEGARSRIVIHPHEGPLMAETFELYATGWWSIKRLALHLAAKGLLSKSGGPLPHSHLQRLLGTRSTRDGSSGRSCACRGRIRRSSRQSFGSVRRRCGEAGARRFLFGPGSLRCRFASFFVLCHLRRSPTRMDDRPARLLSELTATMREVDGFAASRASSLIAELHNKRLVDKMDITVDERNRLFGDVAGGKNKIVVMRREGLRCLDEFNSHVSTVLEQKLRSLTIPRRLVTAGYQIYWGDQRNSPLLEPASDLS